MIVFRLLHKLVKLSAMSVVLVGSFVKSFHCGRCFWVLKITPVTLLDRHMEFILQSDYFFACSHLLSCPIRSNSNLSSCTYADIKRLS